VVGLSIGELVSVSRRPAHKLARIAELHSDEAPEILALPISDGLPAYLRWMDNVVTA
jgi:uncharacterized protein involved in tolerance to divalent cations